jgi:hypothetical protein
MSDFRLKDIYSSSRETHVIAKIYCCRIRARNANAVSRTRTYSARIGDLVKVRNSLAGDDIGGCIIPGLSRDGDADHTSRAAWNLSGQKIAFLTCSKSGPKCSIFAWNDISSVDETDLCESSQNREKGVGRSEDEGRRERGSNNECSRRSGDGEACNSDDEGQNGADDRLKAHFEL